jgi:hypothetical protein
MVEATGLSMALRSHDLTTEFNNNLLIVSDVIRGTHRQIDRWTKIEKEGQADRKSDDLIKHTSLFNT